MRMCRTCELTKNETDFNIVRSTYKGIQGNIYYEHYRLDCKECHAIAKHKRNLTRLYNVTSEQFNQLLIDQNNKCAICKNTFTGKEPYMDHCHTTGKSRGLLCTKCNFGIGHFNDNIDLLTQAIDYLKAWLQIVP